MASGLLDPRCHDDSLRSHRFAVCQSITSSGRHPQAQVPVDAWDVAISTVPFVPIDTCSTLPGCRYRPVHNPEALLLKPVALPTGPATMGNCLGSTVVQQFLQQCVLDKPGYEQLQQQLQQELAPPPAPAAPHPQQLGSQLNLTVPHTNLMHHMQYQQQGNANQQHTAQPVVAIDDDDDFADLDWDEVDQLCNQHQQQPAAAAAPAGAAGAAVSALQHLQQHNPGIMQDAPAAGADDDWNDWDLAELDALEAAATAKAAAWTLAHATPAAPAAGTAAEAAAMPGASNVTYWHAAGDDRPKKSVRFEDAVDADQQYGSNRQQGQHRAWAGRPMLQPQVPVSAFEELTSAFIRPEDASYGRTGEVQSI
jgi:hypothetical protein